MGPATVDPTSAVADTPVAGVVDTTTATVGETGGNSASQSGGTVQVGGNNSATQSVGTAQVSKSKASTTAQVKAADATVSVGAPASIGGSGSNTSHNSVVAAQVGSGNTAGGSTGSVQVQPTTAGASIAADASGIAPAAKGDVSASGEQVLGDTLGVDLSSLGTLPGPGTLFILQLVHSLLPGVDVTTGPGAWRARARCSLPVTATTSASISAR